MVGDTDNNSATSAPSTAVSVRIQYDEKEMELVTIGIEESIKIVHSEESYLDETECKYSFEECPQCQHVKAVLYKYQKTNIGDGLSAAKGGVDIVHESDVRSMFTDNYNIVDFINDFHHLREAHSVDDEANPNRFEACHEFITGVQPSIRCHSSTCNAFRRQYRRRRGNEHILDDEDYREAIVRQIHCYLVHSTDVNKLTRKERIGVEAQSDPERRQSEMNAILRAKSKSLADIMEDTTNKKFIFRPEDDESDAYMRKEENDSVVLLVVDAIEELKEKKKNLSEFKDQIIEYFEQNPDIDSDRLLRMSAKDLATSLAEHCGSKKIKGCTGALLKRLQEMVETRNPRKMPTLISSTEGPSFTSSDPPRQQKYEYLERDDAQNLEEFQRVTGCTEEVAVSFLRDSEWNMTIGLHRFYEHGLDGIDVASETDNKSMQNDDIYSNGVRFWYWNDETRPGNAVLARKIYSNLKEEMVMAGQVNISQWNGLVKICKTLLKTHGAQRTTTSGNGQAIYGIPPGIALALQWLLGLKLYIDFDDLNHKFCDQFREKWTVSVDGILVSILDERTLRLVGCLLSKFG